MKIEHIQAHQHVPLGITVHAWLLKVKKKKRRSALGSIDPNLLHVNSPGKKNSPQTNNDARIDALLRTPTQKRRSLHNDLQGGHISHTTAVDRPETPRGIDERGSHSLSSNAFAFKAHVVETPEKGTILQSSQYSRVLESAEAKAWYPVAPKSLSSMYLKNFHVTRITTGN